MNLLKKYIWLAISVGVALVLLAVVGARLFFVFKNYQKEKQELDAARTRVEQLYQSKIFPSAANIAREKEKLADLVDEYNELDGWLSAGQITPQEMEAAEFMTFLENTLRRIRDQLQVGRVVFPDKYTFGFEKYAGGQLPMPKNIPRLLQQLKITENICRILPDSAVSELISFGRDEFESVSGGTAPDAQAGRRGAPPPAAVPSAAVAPGENLVSTQHFKIAFRARESSAFDFLNRLASLPMFTAITWVEINNPRQETAMTGAGAAQPAAAEKPKATAKDQGGQASEVTREKRIILGREEVEVKAEFDVYNFGPFVDFKEGRTEGRRGKPAP